MRSSSTLARNCDQFCPNSKRSPRAISAAFVFVVIICVICG